MDLCVVAGFDVLILICNPSLVHCVFQSSEHLWRAAGDWSLEVTAVDGAGNAAASNLSHYWTVSFPASRAAYARFSAAPLGPVGAVDPAFSVQVTRDPSGCRTSSGNGNQ